jgi:hypothetical protein
MDCIVGFFSLSLPLSMFCAHVDEARGVLAFQLLQKAMISDFEINKRVDNLKRILHNKS